MVGAERLLPDREGALVQWFRLIVQRLLNVQRAKIVQLVNAREGSKFVKIFNFEDFGYRRIQVERILRRRRREQEAWEPGRRLQNPGRGHDTLLPATVRAHAAAPDCETACGSPSSVTSGERAPGM